MKEQKQQQIEEELAHTAARFFNEISDRSSLITVTRAQLSESGREATIFVTILPEALEEKAVALAQRNEKMLRDYIDRHTRIGIVPRLTVMLDEGEKHRQRIEELS